MKWKNLVLMLVLALMQVGFYAYPARARELRNEPGGQLHMVSEDGKEIGICPLKHTDVQVDISGFVARVNVMQQFENSSKKPVEAVYTFPLPEDAAVDRMTMVIGKRRIVGRIKRKEEARKIYEEAKSAGKTASLLDQERPNIFTQSVANIMPGQKIIVAISYVNVLKYDEGGYEFSFPMTVGPRYTPTGGYNKANQRGAPSRPGATSSDTHAVVNDADKITPPVAVGKRAGHDISLSVKLDAGVPLQKIESVLHEVNVTRSGNSRAEVKLKDEATIPNRDFILKYTTAGAQLQTALLTHAAKSGDGYFTLIFQPPLSPPQKDVAPKEMVFVIDQTGSQGGWPIKKSKETMRYCINHLNPGDTFQLLGFNTELYPCFPKPVEATPDNIAKALKFLEPIEGSGGTDILKSVEYALQLPDDPARLRIVCYMTDGYIGNDMQVVDYIRNNHGRARMFPFGIGNSVNRFLIDEMAREGRGVPEYVTLGMSQDDVESMWDREQTSGNKTESEKAAMRVTSMASAKNAAQRFYARIAQPVLLNPEVNWNGLPVADVYPNPIPDVFTSGPIILKGRYTHGAEGDITVSGILRGKEWKQTIHVKFPDRQREGSALPSLWAREQIANFQAQDWMGAQNNSPNPEITEKIIQTALRYRLMSQYTSFVAVQQKIVNKTGTSRKADVPVELGEGLDANGFFEDADTQDESPTGAAETAAKAVGAAAQAAAAAAQAAAAATSGTTPVAVKPSVQRKPARQATARRNTRVATRPAATSPAKVANSGAQYRVAAGSTFVGQAGDPLITVEGPSDALQVIALLPGGEIKKLRYNTANQKWEARFDIPTYAGEGDYLVTVIVVAPGGQRKTVKLHYRVDLTAPAGEGKIRLDTANRQSGTVHLEIEGDKDTSRVAALLPWGVRADLKQGEDSFAADVAVPEEWRNKPFSATFILTDIAHNRTLVTLDMSR